MQSKKKIHVLTDFVTTARFNHEKNLLATKTALTTVENKIPDVSNLATKTSLRSVLPVSTFNSKVTELEGKVTTVDNTFSGFVKKTDYGAEITKIKNDYATNASLDSKLNDLKAQHISTEVTKIDSKTKKNASHILGFESRLKQKEDILNEVQRENSFHRGFQNYLQESYTVQECRTGSFNFSNGKITKWKSTGIFNYLENSDLNVSSRATANLMPFLENNGRMNVEFNGYYLAQNKAIHPNNNKVVNIYIVYKLGLINNYRTSVYTIQNVLFGAMKITKNATNKSRNKYEGYGICFDSGGKFSKGNITDGKNVI